MARETVLCVAEGELASGRFFQGMGREALVTHGRIESLNRRIVTDQTLEIRSIAFEYPGLHALSHSPADRD
jgi:hypothetical protein